MTQAQIVLMVLQIIRGLVQRQELGKLAQMSDAELAAKVREMQDEYKAGWDAWDKAGAP